VENGTSHKKARKPLIDIRAHYLSKMGRYKPMKHECLLKEYENHAAGDKNAHERIALSFSRLVLKKALYFSKRYHLPVEDMIQEGMCGLMTAVKKFDPTRENRFSTYGSWWIDAVIRRAVHNKYVLVRMPIHGVKAKRKIQKAYAEGVKHGKIGEATGLTPKMVTAVMGAVHREEISEEFEEELTASTIDKMATPPLEEIVEQESVCKGISRYLSKLKKSHQLIINMRFGLNGYMTNTLEECGEYLGVTRERIRQIQAQALANLKSLMRHNKEAYI